MAQTLSLSQSQRLQMMLAPQLRQSLEMLQLPILELRTLIQQEMEQNPTIEEAPNQKDTIEIEPGNGEVNEKEAQEEMDFEKEFEALAKLDDEWRDYFFQDQQMSYTSAEDEEKRQYMLESIPQQQSLQEHLMEQLSLTGLSDADLQIGELIIGSIDDDGHLTSTLEELSENTGADLEHLEDILSAVQEFHPSGVGARNLSECLIIQLDRLGHADSLAAEIIRDHIDLLGTRKYAEIAKAIKVPIEEVQEAAKIVSTLDPKPGRLYSDEATTYILPEIVVQKVDGKYLVILNDDQLPHVRISNHYRRLMRDPDTKPEVRQYVQERIRAGAFLIKSIHQRQRTIERIAVEIVSAQQDFLEHGLSKLKPMTMASIAETVGVHETTVSRAVSGKYMKTPSGVYELKYFFTPGLKREDGSEVSNKTVKDIIAQLVGNEDPTKPLSDQEIMETLKEQGIKVARRTIAKYRLMLRIPPSHMRKMY